MKPSAVGVGVPKVGVSAARSAVPGTLALPEAYPLRVVVTVTVAEPPGLSPVTVKSSVEPDGVPTETEPAVVVGAGHVKFES